MSFLSSLWFCGRSADRRVSEIRGRHLILAYSMNTAARHWLLESIISTKTLDEKITSWRL